MLAGTCPRRTGKVSALCLNHTGSALPGISHIFLKGQGGQMGTSNLQSFCSLLCFTDHSVCLQGKMANQPTGGWRRPWTASRGSSRQPAWPVQLSETPHEATRHPSRPKAPLGYLGLHGLGPAGSQQPPARGSTAQYYPRRQLAAAAHCLTEHRFPCPQNAGRAGCHVGTPRRGRRGGGARRTSHPSIAI